LNSTKKSNLSKIVFATTPATGGNDSEVALLANSLRRNGGGMAGNPFWVMVAESQRLNQDAVAELKAVQAECIPYHIPAAAQNFPFAAKVFAAESAEQKAQAVGCDLLVWMDPDTIILQEPREFILEKIQKLGCRPVHLALISSPFGQPLDEFWSAIYRECGVNTSVIFPIETVVDRRQIRPNFNAGLLVVRPQLGLLQAWSRHFNNLYQDAVIQSFYERNSLYRIFIHQCALAGSILGKLTHDQIRDFSTSLNYPLHIHSRIPADQRADSWNSLVTVRYDSLDFFEQASWEEILAISGPLLDWLQSQLSLLNIS
jgi:hypothetical protein